jgi:CheY-like chemotaxis protein
MGLEEVRNNKISAALPLNNNFMVGWHRILAIKFKRKILCQQFKKLTGFTPAKFKRCGKPKIKKPAMPLNNKILLIVDDDPDDRSLFIEAVKEIDETVNCISATNGQEALELLNNGDRLPDFIILDLRMPRYDGKKCLFEIKHNSRLAHIPVIIYTTSKNVEESNELRHMGACHFMTKPRNYDEIYYMASFVLGEMWHLTRP